MVVYNSDALPPIVMNTTSGSWQKANGGQPAGKEVKEARDLPHELTAKMSSYIMGLFAAMIFNTVPIYFRGSRRRSK